MRHPALAALLASLALPALAQTECWADRKQFAKEAPQFAPLYTALHKAEKLIAANQAFLATPVPVRMQASMEAGDYGGHLFVAAYPEKTKYSQVWTKVGKCGVGEAADTINAGIGQLGIKFNDHVSAFLDAWERPAYEGTLGGYPVYKGWVLITKNGRLPWVPQTLADRLDREAGAREKKLAEWRTTLERMKMPDEAATRKTYDMLKKSDPAGAEKFLASARESGAELARQHAEVYPATTRQLELAVAEVRRYRASFTPAQLAAPATWADGSGAGRKQLDAAARALMVLPAEAKQAIDALAQESRALTRQMQEAQRARDAAQADSLKAQLAVLARRARAIRQQHEEQAAIQQAEMGARFALENLKPGDMDNALAFKADPGLPERKDINRIQVISVRLASKGQEEGRGEWMKAVQGSFDFAALAAMLK